jgi:two-component system, response regulator YesN
MGMPEFSNIIAPLIAGLFFLLYFLYFIIANPSKAASYRYFIIFLIGISVFSIGRPLQISLGPHPLPLLIVNIRMLILCSIIVPVIILASDLFTKRRGKRFQVAIMSVCALLGLTYVVFNTLGTSSSKVLFHFAGITVQDNYTPAMQPPFYGREVTIWVQIVTGLLLLVFSFIKLFKLKLETPIKDLLKNKIFLFNSGVFIFALSFIVGSYTRQWGIYYAASVVSALLFGGSVLIDVRGIYHDYERLIPFIKEDIIDNVAFSEFSKTKLTEMLGCLGKGSLNTMVMVKLKASQSELLHDLKMTDEALEVVNKCLGAAFSEDCYLPLYLSNCRIGIALRLPEDPEAGKRTAIWDVLEDIRAEIRRNLKCEVAIGIGRSYGKLEDLRISYHEALNAQEYAERFAETSIVHVDNIHEFDRHTNGYPVKEKERVLSLIKVGDVENCRKAFADFMAKFKPFISEKPEVLKVRLYEFIGSLMDAAVLGGGDEKKLNGLVGNYFDDIDHVKDAEIVELWLSKVVVEVAGMVAHVYEKRSKSLVRNAMKFVDANYRLPLSYKDVAKEVFVSPSYFLSLFKRETGLTFVDYLTEVRIDRAKRLLTSTEMNITEIAFEIGFNNSNYFSSTFKKIVGTTAKEFRNRN